MSAIEPPPFVTVVPGRALSTPIPSGSPNGFPAWSQRIPDPGSVADICVAMTQPLVTDQLGVGVCFRLIHSPDIEFLGVLSNHKPSAVFSTRWPWVLTPGTPEVELVFTLEPAAALLERMALKPPVDVRLELAKRIALNLFRFIESYASTAGQDLWRNPTAILDRWYIRFEEKYQRDQIGRAHV